MITVKNISKKFGRFEALKNINIEIGEGEIVGFLGQNGAGKTTLMRLLTTYLLPDEGTIILDGKDTKENPLDIRKQIGYLPETPPLYPTMTVIDYLKFAARLKDVPAKEEKQRVEQVLSQCQLMEVRHKPIMYLSKGYKQRVGIAQAIVHDPPILILDEPTSGLDPLQIAQVRQLIKGLEKNKTVLLSTHILSEIEQMARRVVMIKQGQILKDDSLDQLIESFQKGQRYLVDFKGPMVAVLDQIQTVEDFKVLSAKTDQEIHQLEIESPHFPAQVNAVIESIMKAGGRIIEIKESRMSLEEIFLRLHNTEGSHE